LSLCKVEVTLDPHKSKLNSHYKFNVNSNTKFDLNPLINYLDENAEEKGHTTSL